MRSDRPTIILRSDRPLIVAVLLLATGLGLVFAYGTGTAAFDAAYPVSRASLQLSISTFGVAAIGGLALTAMGLLSLVLSLIYAIIGQIQLIGPSERVVEREKEWAPKA
jgi:hypothetical protein